MILKIVIQIPKFVATIWKEHLQTERLAAQHDIDFIISDNRYGCWSSKTPSTFITHQLHILMPEALRWIEPLVGRLNKWLIRRFSHCWIPDYIDEKLRLSGKLSTNDEAVLGRVTYIGPLSRFRRAENLQSKYDLVFVLSGPEPQRSIFEQKVCLQLRGSCLRYLVIKGVLTDSVSTQENEIAFLDTKELQAIISQSLLVIARSGYSTIMDLAMLGKKGVLVPTPGQTEQEYLADRWKGLGVFYSAPQHNFDVQEALEKSKSYTGLKIDSSHSDELLSHAVDALLVGCEDDK